MDAPFLGPVLADDLARRVGDDGAGSTIAWTVSDRRARLSTGIDVDGTTVSAVNVGAARDAVDLTRATAELSGNPPP